MGRRIILSFALLACMSSGLLESVAPAAAQDEGGLQGNTYTDPSYGFFVEWDSGVFDAEEMIGDDGVAFGVYLIGEYITASIAAGGYSDVEECLDDRVERLEAIDGVSNFRESSRVDPLEFDREVLGAVYQYRYLNPDTGDSDTFATYFGCEPLLFDDEPQTDIVLTHDFGTPLDMFEDLAPDWVNLVNGIVFAGSTGNTTTRGDDNPTETGGLSGNRYVDPNFAFGLEWDADLFEAEEIVAEGVPVGVNISGDAAFGTAVTDFFSSLRTCVNRRAGAFEDSEGITDLEEVDDVDLPETDPDARVVLLRYTYTNDQTGESAGFLQYIECREILVEGEALEDVYLVFEFASREDEWDGALPFIEEILGSVEWDVPLGGTDDEPTPDDDPTPPDDETGVSGNRYLDANDAWAVEWDDTVLTGENWQSDESGEIRGVQLSSETGNFMTIFTEENRSERACVNNQIDSLEGSSFTDFEEVETVDLPETHEDARVAIFEGIFTSSDGVEVPIYFYIECRVLIVDGEEVEDRFLVVNLLAETGSYEDELPVWSDVLTSLETDAGGGSDGSDPNDDDPAPDDLGESGIDGDTYTSNIGYRITWDDAIYTGELLDEENPDAGLNLSSEASFLTFQVVSDPSVGACVEAEATTVEGLGGMGPLSTSREDPPDSPRGAASEIFDAVLTFGDGSEADVIVYVECRPIGDDSPLFLVIRMITFSDAYQDELPLWQELLDGIEIVGLDL